MKSEQIHTLVLGAGPSGLAAGYGLAKAGLKPVVLERDKVPGGLMRSLYHGEFVVDVGRKELYNRIAKVDALWSEVLGKDYRSYQHRGGILYDGRIIDMSPAYQGFRRGMPWGMFLGCATDFLKARLLRTSGKITNLEQYFYKKRGRRMTQIFSQGFQEKLTGKQWSQVVLPETSENEEDAGLLTTLKAIAVRTFSTKEVNTY
jgi:protoporphyrinogen oxidase